MSTFNVFSQKIYKKFMSTELIMHVFPLFQIFCESMLKGIL